jgi:hypothetical protein
LNKTSAAWGASWDTLAPCFRLRIQLRPNDLIGSVGVAALGDGWFRPQAKSNTGPFFRARSCTGWGQSQSVGARPIS